MSEETPYQTEALIVTALHIIGFGLGVLSALFTVFGTLTPGLSTTAFVLYIPVIGILGVVFGIVWGLLLVAAAQTVIDIAHALGRILPA